MICFVHRSWLAGGSCARLALVTANNTEGFASLIADEDVRAPSEFMRSHVDLSTKGLHQSLFSARVELMSTFNWDRGRPRPQ